MSKKKYTFIDLFTGIGIWLDRFGESIKNQNRLILINRTKARKTKNPCLYFVLSSLNRIFATSSPINACL